jgi:hypothetical protein
VSFALAGIQAGRSADVPLAFLVAVTDLIPLIGATLGAVICIAVALFATRLWPTMVLVLVFFVVYPADRELPDCAADHARAGPAQRRRCAGRLIGGAAMGLIGALMAIPIAAGIKVLLPERLQARDAADAAALRLVLSPGSSRWRWLRRRASATTSVGPISRTRAPTAACAGCRGQSAALFGLLVLPVAMAVQLLVRASSGGSPRRWPPASWPPP